MRVLPLQSNPNTYSCRPYLVLGNWSSLEDVNTIIDPGPDDYILHELSGIYTGVGKRVVEQIILTHNHFDHAGGIRLLKKKLNPTVVGFAPGEGVDRVIGDNEFIRIGDSHCRVIHIPCHSSDSICIFSPEDGILFTGDTTIRFHTPPESLSRDYLMGISQLADLNVKAIYSGHDAPIKENARDVLKETLTKIRQARTTPTDGSEHRIVVPQPTYGFSTIPVS